MKKIISVLTAMVLTVCFLSLGVSAAPSPEVDDVIESYTVVDGNSAVVRTGKIIRNNDADPIVKQKRDGYVGIGSYELVDFPSDTSLPLEVTLKIAGIKSTSDVLVQVKGDDGKVKTIDVKVLGDGQIQFSLDKIYQYFGLFTDKTTATRLGVSDKTGDFATPAILVLFGLALIGTAVSFKKIAA